MKKLLAIALLAGSSAAVFGQGVVVFTGYSTTDPSGQFATFSSPIYIDNVGGAKISGTTGRATMLGGATAGAVAWGVSQSGGTVGSLFDLVNPNTTTISWVNFGTGTSGAGSKLVGIPSVGSTGARGISTVAYGAAATVQVAAWYGATANNYSTWASAYNAAYGLNGATLDTALKIGVSAPVAVGHVSTSSSDPNIPVPAWSSFAVISVPEPTTAAIAGLGLASMLIFRRKKA